MLREKHNTLVARSGDAWRDIWNEFFNKFKSLYVPPSARYVLTTGDGQVRFAFNQAVPAGHSPDYYRRLDAEMATDHYIDLGKVYMFHTDSAYSLLGLDIHEARLGWWAVLRRFFNTHPSVRDAIPYWASYIAVNADGMLVVTADEPRFDWGDDRFDYWFTNDRTYMAQLDRIPDSFGLDWRDSCCEMIDLVR